MIPVITGIVPPPSWGCGRLLPAGTKRELRSNHAPRCILTSKATSSKGDGPDWSTCELVNAGGAGGSLLCMRANSPEWAASTGSEAGCSLGAGRLSGSSSLGSAFFSGDEALSVAFETH